MQKRLLAVLLTAAMLMSLSMPVLAVEPEDSGDDHVEEPVLVCTQEEHTHSRENGCYTVSEEPQCGQEEAEGHTHSDECYASVESWACGLEETEGHAHSEDCYGDVKTLICTETESDGHQHDDGCYETASEPSCGMEEGEGAHTHGDDCYSEETSLSCDSEEEGHEHDDGCYVTESVLSCGEQESDGHTHGAGCYETSLTCEIPVGDGAHTHSDSCYEISEDLICGQNEAEAHTHSDTCGVTTVRGELLCELEEAAGHAHSEDCYLTLTCEKTEHQHTDACYEQTAAGGAGAAQCTCGAAEGEAHAEDCPMYVAPTELDLCKKLLACETLKDMFDLLNANYDAAFALAGEDLDVVEAHLDTVYAASDDDGYYEELVDIIAVLREELSSGEWQRMERTLYTGASGASGDLNYSKELITKDDESLSIQLEAWTEGAISTKETEIVLVVDQSGSMYSAVDGASSAMSYEKFLEDADKDKGAQHPGYYVAVAENVYYNPNGNSSSTDINNQYYRVYQYAVALLRYNTETERWERSKQVNVGGSANYNDLEFGVVFNGYNDPTENTQWYALDSNSSKFDDNSAKYYKSIYGAAMDGLFAFADGVKDAQNCKIAVVGFSSPSSYGVRWDAADHGEGGSNYGGTGLFIDGEFVHTSDLGGNAYESAFMSTSTDMENIVRSLQNIVTNYSETTTQEGFMLANKILETGNDDANKVVVLFTDGAPTRYYNEDGAVVNTASGAADSCNAAIAEAYKTKSQYNADVYSFGPSVSLADNALKMLQLCSSDYPNAQSLNEYDSSVQLEYSAVAGDSEELEKLLSEVAQKIYDSSQLLNEDTVVKDVITPYFEIPVDEGEELKDKIKVYSVVCTGADPDTGATTFGDATDITSSVTITVTTNTDEDTGSTTTTVNVTGFDYVANCVYPSEPAGAKLRIVIPITARDEFLGGNGVATNTEESGIYNGEDLVGDGFDVPTTDVGTNAKAEMIDVSVYLGAEFLQTVTVDDVKKTIKVGYGGIELDLSKDNYGLADWQDDYIALKITLYDAAGNEVTQFSEVKQDTKYTVKVSVKPSNPNGTIPESTAVANGTIHVFYPELTFSDSEGHYYGEIIPANTAFGANGQVTAWKNSEGQTPTDAGVTTMVGNGDYNDAPEITFTCAPVDSTLTTFGKTDVPMDVTITKIGTLTGNDLNQYVWFKWDGCDHGCVETQIADHKGGDESAEFYLHVETCQLTITKTGGASEEPYVFTILKKDTNGDYRHYTEASITGPGSVTIYELPVGEYKVEENTDWSWRFIPSYTVNGSEGNTVTLSSADGRAMSVSCTNTANNNIYWLNGYSSVWINDYGDKKEDEE